MNEYCLDRQELSAFLEKEFKLPIISISPHIDTVIEQWENWEICLHCTATLLSQVLENKQKHYINVYKILDGIYKFSDIKGLFTIEQIDENFLDFMFDNIRNPNLEIEDNLIQIKQELNERKY